MRYQFLEKKIFLTCGVQKDSMKKILFILLTPKRDVTHCELQLLKEVDSPRS